MKPRFTSVLVVFGLALDITLGGVIQPAKPAHAAAPAPEAVNTIGIGWAGTGGGTVNYRYSTTTGSCTSGSTCNVIGDLNGAALYITATAYISSTFVSWTNCNSTSGDASSICRVNSGSGDRTVTATFSLSTVPVSVTLSGSGSVTSTPSGINCTTGTCSSNFGYGTPVTLTAAPSTGWSFTNWTGGLCNGSTSPTCAVTITTTRNVTANFTVNNYPLSVAISGTGTVTSTPSGINCTTGTCSNNFNYGTPVTLTASPGTGWSFTNWTGGLCNGSASPTCATPITTSRAVTANFTINHYPLTVTVSGSGSVTSTPSGINCSGGTCSSSFDYGTSVTLTAIPETGWLFTRWKGTGCNGTGACITTITGTQSITATFIPLTYTVAVTKAGNGAGSVASSPSGINCGAACSTTYDYNTPVTLTAAANTGSTFTGWAGDCTANGLTCTTTITGTRNVTATFTLITYTLSVTNTGNGSGSVTSSPAGIDCGETCNTTYDYNTSVTLTASANTGSFFAGWTGNCLANGLTCVTTITNTRNVTATFTLITYTVSVTRAGNGSGSVTSTPGTIDCGATCNASFDYDTPVTLTAAANTGSTFTGWTGDCDADGLTCTTTITGARHVTATFTLITYTLSVAEAGNGAGVITSEPSGIDCGVTCTASYDYNTIVTLTANTNTGSLFTGWAGDCVANGLSCSATLTGTRNVTATFTLITYTLSVTQTGNGFGSITSVPGDIDCGASCTSSFSYGTQVTLSAVSNADSLFDHWSGDCAGNTSTCVITLTAARDVQASFVLITHTVSVGKAGNGSGSITSEPSGIDCGSTCAAAFDHYTVVTLTASADTGSSFTGWEGDCEANGLSCTTTVTDTRNVTATFTLVTNTVSIVKAGNGAGSITSLPNGIDCGTTCDASFDYNTPVTLTASADTGSTFTGWAGDCAANGATCTTTVTGTRNVTATFTLITYTLSIAKGGTGFGNIGTDPSGINCGATCNAAYDYNTVVTLTASPDMGYYLVSWQGDCSAGGLICTTTLTGTRNVTATFAPVTYTLWVAKDGNGTGILTSTPEDINCGATCDSSLDYDTVVTLTAYPDADSLFDHWSGDCSTDGQSCITTITATRDVTATFILVTHTVSISKAGNGSGNVSSQPGDIDCGPTCAATFDHNTLVTLTASADMGSTFAGWQGDCAGNSLTCTTTVTGTRNVSATFTLITYTLSVFKDGNGAAFGSVTSDPGNIDCGATCSESYDYNTPVTLTAEVITGALFSGWTGNCTANGLSCTTTVTGTRNVTATFSFITYTVSVSMTGSGSGSVTSAPSGVNCGATCSGSFNYTSTVTLTATADTGSTFIGWTGDCIGTLPCAIPIDGAKHVTATFTLVTYTLSLHKAGNGSGSIGSIPAGIDCGLTCTTIYDYGTVVTLTQQPVTGSAFIGWAGDCNGSGTCAVTILGNQSVTATFNLITTDLGVHQSVTRSLGTITFTVVITNGGPSGANGAIFSDTVTSEVGNPQWHCQAGHGASCPAADVSLSLVSSGVYSVYAALPSFPVGGVVTYTISGEVGLLAQRLTNDAQVIAPTGVTDVSKPDDASTLISGYCVMFPVVTKGN